MTRWTNSSGGNPIADDVHDLSALYALDALTGDERVRFERHLDDCDRCQSDVRTFAATTADLAFLPEGPAPPEALRDRILLTARAERQTVVRFPGRRSAAVSVAATLAVAASAAAVGFGIWAASLHSSLTRAQKLEAVIADPGTRRVSVTGAPGALYVSPSGRAALSVRLPRLPAGKAYEAWVIDGSSAPQPAGVFTGGATVLRHGVRSGSVVKVTVEQASGADQPTTQPILSSRA